MSITQKIQESVKAATEVRCYYQSAEALNRIADYAEMPCAAFTLLEQQQLTTDNGNYRERVQIAMFFVDVTEFDFEAAQNELIIQGCKRLALQWLKALQQSKTLRLIANNGTQRVYDEADAILTGFAVNVTLEEIEGECVNG